MSWYYYAIDEENKIKYCLDKDINAKKLLPFLLYTIDDKPITLLCDEMYEELDKYSDYEPNDFLQTSKSFKDYNDDVIDYCELSYADFYDIFNAVKGKYVDISNYIRYSYGLVYMNYMNEGKVWLYNRKSLHIK